MRTVFADTLYWVAAIRPHDPWCEPAKQARKSLGECLLVTSDEVLDEFLTALCAAGPEVRQRAVQTVRAILSNPNVKVVA